MANKHLNRRFSVREIILMVVLVVVLFIGLYFWLVFYPIQNRLTDLEEQREDLEFRISINESLERNYDEMVAEIEKIMQMPEEERTYMPEYGDAQQEALALCFTTIFSGMDANITYPTASESGGVYTRPVSFSFTVNEKAAGEGVTVYEKTVSVIDQLLHTGYRCLMTSFSVSPDSSGSVSPEGSGSLRVSCNINFYELA